MRRRSQTYFGPKSNPPKRSYIHKHTYSQTIYCTVYTGTCCIDYTSPSQRRNKLNTHLRTNASQMRYRSVLSGGRILSSNAFGCTESSTRRSIIRLKIHALVLEVRRDAVATKSVVAAKVAHGIVGNIANASSGSGWFAVWAVCKWCSVC